MPTIVIDEYRAAWPAEFGHLASRLRSTLGDTAARIDHIGSTAVPGLAAKDVIDVQITVTSLDDSAVEPALAGAGARRVDIHADHVPAASGVPAEELAKQLYVFEAPDRRSNVHVRAAGRYNQRYALLCRDWLRTHPSGAAAYAEIKRRLAGHFPDDLDAYYSVKDPTFDLLMTAAFEWAEATHWSPGPSDG
ncbi:MAG: GrpB family protein [Ilumatobacteraceae bacterium]